MDSIANALPMPAFKQDYPLKDLNTFGVDARASMFASPSTAEELAEIIRGYNYRELPFLVIGEGSNVLFRKHFDGLVLKPAFSGIELLEDHEDHVLVAAGAAENWDAFVQHTIENGWYGLENLSLIPGSVGSAPVQNIGAYGTELNNHFSWLEAWDLDQHRMIRLEHQDCRFGYRSSIFKEDKKGRFIILRVAFSLSKVPELQLSYGTIRSVFNESGGKTPMDLRQVIISVRRQKLPDPLEYGNAGSFFKNPVVDRTLFKCLRVEYKDIPNYREPDNQVKIPAAWLIEKSGWKGRRIGEVGTWPNQPLVIVNYGNATGKDIYDFSLEIQDAVDASFGICLEREVNVI